MVTNLYGSHFIIFLEGVCLQYEQERMIILSWYEVTQLFFYFEISNNKHAQCSVFYSLYWHKDNVLKILPVCLTAGDWLSMEGSMDIRDWLCI